MRDKKVSADPEDINRLLAAIFLDVQARADWLRCLAFS
jgi:hypothetical protein